MTHDEARRAPTEPGRRCVWVDPTPCYREAMDPRAFVPEPWFRLTTDGRSVWYEPVS